MLFGLFKKKSTPAVPEEVVSQQTADASDADTEASWDAALAAAYAAAAWIAIDEADAAARAARDAAINEALDAYVARSAAAQASALVPTIPTTPVSAPADADADARADGRTVLTTNPSEGTTTLIESLRGISIPGTQADLLLVKVAGLERAKQVAMRGTKGVNRDEPTRFVRFIDMSTDHLYATLANGINLSKDERRIIESILEDRQAAADYVVGDAIDSDEPDTDSADEIEEQPGVMFASDFHGFPPTSSSRGGLF